MARLVGIDYGSRRIGIAVTDTQQLIATGLKTLKNVETIDFLRLYLQKEPVEAFIVGYPIRLNGQESQATKESNQFVEKLKKNFPDLPVYRVDERFTSKMASQAILMSGVKKKGRQDKELIDTVSATIILQSFLEQKNNQL